MLKIPSRLSIILSLTLSIIFFIICIVGAVFLPSITDILISVRDSMGIRENMSAENRLVVHILAYAVLAVIALADILLFSLLLRVRSGKVFTSASVGLIRGVSWCCCGISAVFAVLGIYFHLAFIVAFAAIFLGLCLRVVKNVIEEATEIKSENDLTV